MSPRGRGWVLALVLLPALAGCGDTGNPYDIPPLLAGVVRLDASLADAAGTPTGTRTTSTASGARVWLVESGRAVDSTLTLNDGVYLFELKLNHVYRTQAGVRPGFVDSSNQITADRHVGYYPDTLRLRRAGDLVSRPNPFTTTVVLSFQLAADARVDIGIYDLAARRVRVLAARTFAAGSYQLSWDGTDETAQAVPNGMYWVLLQTPGGTRAELVIKQP
jgi:hypothetical protein